MAALALTAAPARGDEPPCSETVPVTGEAQDVAQLRAQLRRGPLAAKVTDTCHYARVALVREGDDWNVTLRLGDSHVQRQVSSVSASAAWVESWLLPALANPPPGLAAETRANDESTPPTTSGRSAPPGTAAASSAANQAEATAASGDTLPPARIALLSTLALGSDRSWWAGGELGGQLPLSRMVWLGAGIGGAWDPAFGGSSAVGDHISRRLFRASGRLGLDWQVARRTYLTTGVGVGVLAADVLRSSTDESASADHGAVFAELIGQVGVGIIGNLALVGGLGLRARTPTQRPAAPSEDQEGEQTGEFEPGPPLPDPSPWLMGEARLGAEYRFGGGP